MPLRDYYHRHSRALFWEIQVSSLSFFVKMINSSPQIHLLHLFRTLFHLEITQFSATYSVGSCRLKYPS